MLAIVHALIQAKVNLASPLLVLGNVGEEGEGDLRGVRHFYRQQELAGRVAAHIVLDGSGADSAVTQALGSRRYRITITGPGGHSFTDAGTPNPIAALAMALATLAQTPMPETPSTTLNLGTVHGGTSVNSIPESATATVDFRSTDAEELLRLEVALHRAVEDAADHCNTQAKIRQSWIVCMRLIATLDCSPNRASVRRMRIFLFRWGCHRSLWAQGAKERARTRWQSGIATRTAKLACAACCC
jgi:acetylornithine deacetylase/succinyl-diaminopimelate desuccinylase-like protein